MIKGNQGFDDFERDIFHAIQKRHRERCSPLVFRAAPDDSVPENPIVQREVTGIDVSFWLHCELRKRAGFGAVDRIAIDYCDGNGPRARWFGLICTPTNSLEGLQAILNPPDQPPRNV